MIHLNPKQHEIECDRDERCLCLQRFVFLRRLLGDFCTLLIGLSYVHHTSENLAKYFQIQSLLPQKKSGVICKENSKEKMKLMQTVMIVCSNSHQFDKTKGISGLNAGSKLSLTVLLKFRSFSAQQKTGKAQVGLLRSFGPFCSLTAGKTGRRPGNHPHDRKILSTVPTSAGYIYLYKSLIVQDKTVKLCFLGQ